MRQIKKDDIDRDIEIFELVEQGTPISEVCKKFNLSRVRVRNVYQEVFSFLYENGNIATERLNKKKKHRDYKNNPRYKEIAKECFELKQKGWSDKRIAKQLNTKPVTVKKAIDYYKNV